MTQSFWDSAKQFGTIIAIAAGIMTLSIGAVSIYNFFVAPSGRLLAIAKYSPFEFPPGIDELLTKTQSLELQKYFTDKHDQISATGNKKSSYLENLNVYPYLKTVWFINIQNNGNLTCAAVKMRIPYASLTLIRKEGSGSIAEKINGIVNIGDLGPREEAEIIVWSDASEYSFFFPWNNRGLQLNYKDGIGKVLIKHPTGPLWVFLEQSWFFVLYISIVLIIGIRQIVRIKSKKTWDGTKGATP